MAISLIATVSADQASGNISITHGLTLLAGDVLVAFINVNQAGNTVTDNNGSTAFTSNDNAANPDSAVAYVLSRVCGSSEPSAYAFTLGASDRSSTSLRQYRGVDSSIWDVTPAAGNRNTGNGDSTAEAPAITIVTSGACGLVLMADDLTPTTTTYSSIDNGYTNVQSESGQEFQVTADKLGLSTGTTGITTVTSSSTVAWIAWQVALKPATSTIEQEGFRWGVDDGNEAAHTWEAAQDTNISIASGQSRLLRNLLNTTGDYASSAFKLKYQKNGSGGYATVPIGATSVGTQPLIEAADCTVSGSNTAAASWAVSHPAASTGDLLIFYIAWDDSTTTTGVTAPAGANSETLTAINATPITDTATETRAKAWYCICTGSWTATTKTFTPSATESWSATVVRVPAGEFDSATPIGTTGTRTTTGVADTSVLSVAMTAGASDGSGTLLWFAGVDTDPLGATNPTGWTILQRQDLGAVAHGVAKRDTAVSNSESIAGGDTWTIAGDSWTSIGVIVRAPITNNETYITTSANITAGGEATTARLTAPSGKTTSDFVTGRRWDDENGTDAIDITTDDYSEFEWLVALKSGLADSTYFDYRVYNGDVALDTYTTTARWTVSGSVTITLDTATITALGRALTLVPGAVSKTLSTASLSATGRAFTVVPGAFSLLLDTASLSATGQASTIVPGAATTLLDTAALLANGQAFTVVPGAFTLTLDTAILTATGQIIQVGNINTILLDTATLSANGQAVTLLPGAVSTLLDTALLTLNGQAFTVIPGASTRILSTALLSASGQVLDVIPGAVTKTLSTALLSALGQSATLVPGAVTIAMDTAQINASGIAITIQAVGGAVTVILDTATLLAGGIALDVIPGDISTLLDTAQLTASGIQSSVIPGGVIIGLDTAALLANGQGLTLDVILQAVIRAWTLRERDTAWTLENRATGWTLRNRDTEWSLDDRDTDWSLRGRKTDWNVDDR